MLKRIYCGPLSQTGCLFLDRDGVLNERLPGSYVLQWDELVFCEGMIEALAPAATALPLIIVSNQRCVRLGLISPGKMEALMERVKVGLAERGLPIAAWYVCPHGDEEACGCRKPLPGLLQAAAEDLGVDLTRSSMIGDSPADVAAGNAAGCARSFLVHSSNPQSMAAAVREVLEKPFYVD